MKKDSRKLQRKKERQEKKQKKVKHPRLPQNLTGDRPTQGSKGSFGRNKRSYEGASQINSNKRPKMQNKFMEMIQAQVDEGTLSVASSKLNRKAMKKSLSVEDAALKKLEANLGITKASGKDRLNKEFEKDGLGEDFGDFLASLDDLSKKINNDDESNASEHESAVESDELDESDEEMDPELQKEMDMLAKEDAAFLDGFNDLPTDDEEEDDDLAQFDTDDDEDESDSETKSNTLANQSKSARATEDEEDDEQNEEDDEEMVDEDAEESELDVEEEKDEDESQEDGEENSDCEEASAKVPEVVEEDIYGRPKVPQTSAGRYVPPHLRRAATSSEEALREVRRRVNGQFNRLAESNMESIALEFESIYRQHVRSDVNRVLLESLYASCCHDTQVMTQLITVSTALLGALFHSVGTEVIGFFIENIVQKFHQSVLDARESPQDDEKTISKHSSNLLLMITNLYAYETVHCKLVYDIFRFLVESFTPIDVELLLLLLQHSGPSLRSDDASALSDMVSAIQSKAAQHEESRVRFLLELISNLKKSKAKSKQHSDISLERQTHLRKWIGRVKSRVGHSNNALRVSFSELLEADAQGRWWIIGGTWVPPSNDANNDKNDKQKNALLRLAEKQRMNTDVRRSIFCAIMGATDCIEAYDAVLKLGLKDKQEREIIRVILHCCGQESKYNPYYALLATKFAETDQRYKFTLQLAYWDIFKQMQEWKPRKVYNLGCMLASLLESGAMSLSCLKVLDFTELGASEILFLKVVFEKLLLVDDDNKLIDVIERIAAQKSKMTATKDGITVFLHQHMMNLKFKDPKGKSRVKKVIHMLEAIGKH